MYLEVITYLCHRYFVGASRVPVTTKYFRNRETTEGENTVKGHPAESGDGEQAASIFLLQEKHS